MTIARIRAALDQWFKASAALKLLLGDPVRFYNGATKVGAFPHVIWQRWESRMLNGPPNATYEHSATLEIQSRAANPEEVRLILDALLEHLNLSPPTLDGGRIILILPLLGDVMRGVDLRSWRGVLRVKVISETN